MTQSNQESLNSNIDVNIDILEEQQVKLNQKVDKIGNFSLNILRSLGIWRLVGYAFLILYILDLGEILIPPQFLNPEWEFQVFGQLIERIAVPFLSLLFIFYGGNYLRKGWEYFVLSSLSWLCLLAGIFFLLAVPLGILNTMRIDKQSNEQITKASEQRLEVLANVQKVLKDVKTERDMEALIQQLNNGNAPIIENEQQLAQAKTNLTDFIDKSRNQINKQSEAVRTQQRKALLKRSVKWNVGSLISGVWFIIIWTMTKWARQRDVAG